MNITHIRGREIFDCRGIPTLECEIILDNSIVVYAGVPSGTSCSSYEARPIYDNQNGFGVQKAIENLETIVAQEILNKEPDVITMDLKLIALDGTPDKSHLGANTMLAASLSIAKAQAISLNMKLYEFIAYLCESDSVIMPYPMFNMINGGAHAGNNFAIQEICIVPMGFSTFRAACSATAQVNAMLAKIIRDSGKKICVGLEGGYVTDFADEQEAFDLVCQAIEKAGFLLDTQYKLAIDVAASRLYSSESGYYHLTNQTLNTQELIDYYKVLIAKYPIYSIEDGLSEIDLHGWQLMFDQLGNQIQIVGDDIFASDPKRIAHGIQNHMANAAVIKPNQIGTLTESLQAALLCKEADINIVASHRSGETEDTFIIDFALGISAGQIKAGGFMRGERISKYNHLLRIEESLHNSLLEKKTDKPIQ